MAQELALGCVIPLSVFAALAKHLQVLDLPGLSIFGYCMVNLVSLRKEIYVSIGTFSNLSRLSLFILKYTRDMLFYITSSGAS
jgi:hypothetical protein